MARRNYNIIYIGIIPAIVNRSGQPYRTDHAGMYHRKLKTCKYVCRIHGGKHQYYYVEERYFFEDRPDGKRLGSTRKIHHFNKNFLVRLSKTAWLLNRLWPFRIRRK